jgi:hypothetical protein
LTRRLHRLVADVGVVTESVVAGPLVLVDQHVAGLDESLGRRPRILVVAHVRVDLLESFPVGRLYLVGRGVLGDS